MYMVLRVHKQAYVGCMGQKMPLELSWIDGQVGAVPVFEDYNKAKEHADDISGAEIVEIEEQEKEGR